MTPDVRYSKKRFRNNWTQFRNNAETDQNSKASGNDTGPVMLPETIQKQLETIQKQFRIYKQLGMAQDVRCSQTRFRNNWKRFRNNSETIQDLKTNGNESGPQVLTETIQQQLETIQKQFRNQSEFINNWE